MSRPVLPSLLAVALIMSSGAAAAAPRRVVSINLCSDQLLLALAGPGQIASLSWLAADPNESPVWEQARRYPSNQGSVEELLALDPDLVLAGRFTGTFVKTLLRRLDYAVIETPPATSLAGIYDNIRIVARALGVHDTGEKVVNDMQRQVAEFKSENSNPLRPAMIIQPGGFTVGADSVAHELLLLAGFENRAAQMGLDRWGSLSLEALLTSGAKRLILASYHVDSPSLANEFFNHRVLRRLETQLDVIPVPAVLFACGTPGALAAVNHMKGAVDPSGAP
jgi:iron complex transport system substrate-binding protein